MAHNIDLDEEDSPKTNSNKLKDTGPGAHAVSPKVDDDEATEEEGANEEEEPHEDSAQTDSRGADEEHSGRDAGAAHSEPQLFEGGSSNMEVEAVEVEDEAVEDGEVEEGKVEGESPLLLKQQGVLILAGMKEVEINLCKRQLARHILLLTQEDLGADAEAFYEPLQKTIKQVSNHPCLLSDPSVPVCSPKDDITKFIESCGKMHALHLVLQSLYDKGHQTMITVADFKMYKVLQDYFLVQHWGFRRLDKNTEDAAKTVKEFNEAGKEGCARCFALLFCPEVDTQKYHVFSSLNAQHLILYNPEASDLLELERHAQKNSKSFQFFSILSKNSFEEGLVKISHQKKCTEDIELSSQNNTPTTLEPADLKLSLAYFLQQMTGKPSNSEVEVEKAYTASLMPKHSLEALIGLQNADDFLTLLFEHGSQEMKQFLSEPDLCGTDYNFPEQWWKERLAPELLTRKRRLSVCNEDEKDPKKLKQGLFSSTLQIIFQFGIRGGNFAEVAKLVFHSAQMQHKDFLSKYKTEKDLADSLESDLFDWLKDAKSSTEFSQLYRRIGVLELALQKINELTSGNESMVLKIDDGLLTSYSRNRDKRWNTQRDASLLSLILSQGYGFWWYSDASEPLSMFTEEDLEKRAEVLFSALAAEDLLNKLLGLELQADMKALEELKDDEVDEELAKLQEECEELEKQVVAVMQTVPQDPTECQVGLQKVIKEDERFQAAVCQLNEHLKTIRELCGSEVFEDGFELVTISKSTLKQRTIEKIRQSCEEMQNAFATIKEANESSRANLIETADRFCKEQILNLNTSQSTALPNGH